MSVTKFSIVLSLLVVTMPLFAQNAGVVGGFGGGLPAYDGPDILGRAGPGAGMRGGEAVPIQVQASLNGEYNSNILGFGIRPDGTFDQKGSFGVNAAINSSGRKLFRRGYIGLDYSGNYSHYTGLTFFNGSNHQLNLAAAKQFGRKLTLFSQTGAGTTNRFLGNQGVFTGSEFEFLRAPTAEIFDSRTFFIGTTAGATYSLSSRQSFRVTGTGSSIRRRARALVDFQSYGASGDWVYRLGRRTSIGVMFQYNHFDFSKVFGETDFNTIGTHISRKIGREWTIGVNLTGAKQSSIGIRTIALDPVLAAILGRSSGSEVFESNNLVYGYGFNVSRRIRRSHAFISSERGIVPGNGLLLTSIQQSAGAGFSHNFSREFAVNAAIAYTKMTSLGFASGAFTGWNGGAGVTYKLTETVGISSRLDRRTFAVDGSSFGRNGYSISVGLTYFPQRGFAGMF